MEIEKVVGKRKFRKLQKSLGGKRIWIPKRGNSGQRDKQFYEKRNKRIRNLRKKGKTVQELAIKYNLSEKRIYNILICGTDEN